MQSLMPAAAHCPQCEDLKNEITALKLKIFWENHSKHELQLAMRYANQDTSGPECVCLTCAESGRKDEEKESEGFECTFKPYFDALLRECGLTIGYCNGKADTDSGNFTQVNDSHFVHLGAREDWSCFAYGTKLWRATSITDPELQKLARLFKALSF